jgi:hypothetical protein
MRAATCSKTANPIRMRDFARLTLCYDEIFARHGSPGHIGRAHTSPAIDAMTIDQSKRPTLQHVSCPAANASTSEIHKIRLPHFNHEFTLLRKSTARQARMSTNSCSRRSPSRGFICLPRRFQDRCGTLLWRSELYSLSSLDEFNRSSTP